MNIKTKTTEAPQYEEKKHGMKMVTKTDSMMMMTVIARMVMPMMMTVEMMMLVVMMMMAMTITMMMIMRAMLILFLYYFSKYDPGEVTNVLSSANWQHTTARAKMLLALRERAGELVGPPTCPQRLHKKRAFHRCLL